MNWISNLINNITIIITHTIFNCINWCMYKHEHTHDQWIIYNNIICKCIILTSAVQH